jgi:hypothetical protein
MRPHLHVLQMRLRSFHTNVLRMPPQMQRENFGNHAEKIERRVSL